MTRAAITRFTPADQRRFARQSGDCNPVHLDAAAARRIVAGEPIVHGVHLLLRMLEAHFGAKACAKPPQRVSISIAFLQPAIVGEPIRFARDAEGRLSAEAVDGGATLAVATIASGAARAGVRQFDRARAVKPPRTPRVRTAADLEGAAGAIALPAAAPLARAFPRAARALGAELVAAVAGLSALVGMECPGRDSLLSAIRIELTPRDRPTRLDWIAERVDRRFGLVKIAVNGAGIAGTIDAFLRPRPAAQPTIAAAAARVAPSDFTGVRALVVGGSRGLGAATAMLVAAGGGTPIVTYAAGADEIAALQRDAKSAGRKIDALRLDVLARDGPRIVRDAVTRLGVTELYYFASPRIFVRRTGPFDERLFDRFATFYVYAFARLSAAALAAAPSLTIFYPSTTAIDDVQAELTEYATAKAAGECVCRGIAEQHARSLVLVRRLPRIATDQTSSILAAPALDPLDAMLPIVREIQQRAAARRA